MNKPERSPANPARFPATERSCQQGEPPVITQTGSISAPFIFVISPKCLTQNHLLHTDASASGSLVLGW
nr:MAG TPA: hypothetical protein [Caudoviricetes sp.]